MWKWRYQVLQKNFLFNIISICLKITATITLTLYKLIFSDYMGWSCRFYPSCSSYATECYNKHSFIKASSLTLRRLLSCHPFSSRQGYDPCPYYSKESQ